MLDDIVSQYEGVSYGTIESAISSDIGVDISYKNNSIMFYVNNISYDSTYDRKFIGWEQDKCYECLHALKTKTRKYDRVLRHSVKDLTNREKKKQRAFLANAVFNGLKEIGYEGKQVF